MKNREQEFEEKCNQILPQYIMANGFYYKISKRMLIGGERFEIFYAEFDGDFFNLDNVHLYLTYNICDSIPKKIKHKKGHLKDATIYVKTLDEAISDCLKKLNETAYKQVDEIHFKQKPILKTTNNMQTKKLEWIDNVTEIGKALGVFQINSEVKELRLRYYIQNWKFHGDKTQDKIYLICSDNSPIECSDIDDAKEKAQQHFKQTVMNLFFERNDEKL